MSGIIKDRFGRNETPDEVGGIVTSDEAALKKAGIFGGDIRKTEGGLIVVGSDGEDRAVSRITAPRVEWANEDVVKYLIIGHAYNPHTIGQIEKKMSQHGCDAVIAFGLGNTKYNIERSVEMLAKQEIPAYIAPGKFEKVDDWKEVMAAMRDKFGEALFDEKIRDMAHYNPRVRSQNHFLLFLPGTFDQQAGGNYVVIPGKEVKTETFKHEVRGNVRIIGLDDHFSFLSPEQGARTIAITHELPKYEEQGIDRGSAARVYNQKDKKYKIVPYEQGKTMEKYGAEVEFEEAFYMREKRDAVIIVGQAPEMEEVVVPLREIDDLDADIEYEKRPIYGNLGNEDLEKTLKICNVSHLISGGNSSKSMRSCNRKGNEAVGNDWSAERHLNLGAGMSEGAYAVLEVREIGKDKEGRPTGIESKLNIHHVCY